MQGNIVFHCRQAQMKKNDAHKRRTLRLWNLDLQLTEQTYSVK